MSRHDFVIMWSSVVLIVLTFAVLGLLLGFAALNNTNQDGQTEEGAPLSQNASTNASEAGSSGSLDISQQSGP